MTPAEAKITYDELITEAKVMNLQKTKEIYTEVHHILPRSLGGTDEKENLIRLLGRKHFDAHVLLSMMYVEGTREWYKMAYALQGLAYHFNKNDYQISAEEYEYAKSLSTKNDEETRQRKREGQLGRKHSIESRQKQSKKLSGRKLTQLHCLHISQSSNKERKRQSMLGKNIGKKWSNEQRKHQSDILKASPKTVGKLRYNAQTVKQYTLNDIFIAKYDTIREAERITGVDRNCISHCCHGNAKTAGKFHWKYSISE